MTNEFRVEMAVKAIENAFANARQCKADNNTDGAYMWFEEAYGMARMFEILTGKKIVMTDGKAVINEVV